MNPLARSSTVLLAGLLAALPGVALAQSPLVAVTESGDVVSDDLVLVRESLDIHIDQQHARTRLHQVFENRTEHRLEGRYHLQLDEGARMTGFAYWNGEQKIVGEVFEKQVARQVYEEVTGLGRDPGLLEREGEGAFSFRLFPIASAERKPVELVWAQWLQRDGNTVAYRVPVARDSAITMRIADDRGIAEVTSDTHALELDGVGTAQVTVRARGRGARGELSVRYRVSGQRWGVSAFVHRDSGHDGYMVTTLATPPSLSEADIVPKDVTLVLDRSGSMSGEPLRRARLAAQAVVARLRPQDRVNVIAFDHGVELLYPTPQPLTDAVRAAADSYIARLVDGGGTNIALALERSLAAQHDAGADARPHVLLFLTDGQSDAKMALEVAAKDAGDARVYTIGVGSGVEKPLLSRLAAMKRGRFTFIESPAAIESKVGRLYAQISKPVLVGLSIDVASADRCGRAARPRPLPDLHHGDELVISSRIAGQGPVTVTVRGERNGAPVAFTYQLDVPAGAQRPWVGGMWAQARVDDLLEEIALYGENEELKNEVIDLALAYDFVTQYTSFLAMPEEELTDNARAALDSERARKQQILAAHKDAVALSRSSMPPGDPILQVRAPASARQVTAYFPFGLVKDLVYDADVEHWRVRFLVPKGVVDGVYEVKIVIVHADDSIEVARIPYTIDSSEPDFEIVTEEVDGGLLVKVVTAEPARLVTVTAVDDPNVRMELTDVGGGVHFEALVPLAPGSHRMRIVVADEARNEAEDTFTVDVPALH